MRRLDGDDVARHRRYDGSTVTQPIETMKLPTSEDRSSADRSVVDRPSADGGRVRPIEPSPLRQFVEGLVCLAMAVVLFRAFHLEGYMISTGSMAPSLYGYHKRIVCPSCEYVFAHGVSFDDSVTAGSAKGDAELVSEPRKTCACPNCGQHGIDVTNVPRNQGDQLLVHKHAYLFQPPRRWEVVVFRNPNASGEAYVKRIVGLPNERVQVRHGDVYVNGEIERKDPYVQRAIRIPVYEHDFAPRDERWEPRWVSHPNAGWSELEPTDDRARENGFQFVPAEGTSDRVSDWLVYRNWIRNGGAHETTVPLDGWPLDAELPDESFLAVRFDARENTLSCIGAMTPTWRDRLLAASEDEDFRSAVLRLYERSHVSPITDVYGYNRNVTGTSPSVVRDLMFTATLDVASERGRVVIRMTDGVENYDWTIDHGAGETTLVIAGERQPLRVAAIPHGSLGRPVEIEMSTFDRQVSVAIDGEPVFEPWLVPDDDVEPKSIREPVRIRVEGTHATLTHLGLYRDVYYTRGRAMHGVEDPHELRDDEYFALGDNSPVSFDSRSWTIPAVPKRLLLGKPLVVHLPSKPGRVRVGSRVAHIRIPDFSRIRYVR